MSKIVLFGASGQLGRDLLESSLLRPEDIVSAPREMRLETESSIENFVKRERPRWVVNAAAMTDVDAAHLDPHRALQVNGLAPAILARAADEVGARVIHISSEAVFSGSSRVPYAEMDPCHPVSIYGVTKLTGDLLTLTYSPDSFILRTSWLYSGKAGNNFPTRILSQLADPGKKISVVTDIVGNPTPTSLLIGAVAEIIASPPDPGVYHICAQEPASKFEWAVEIAAAHEHDPSRIEGVTSGEYVTTAKRPKYVDLDCSKFQATGLLELPNWRHAWVDSCVG